MSKWTHLDVSSVARRRCSVEVFGRSTWIFPADRMIFALWSARSCPGGSSRLTAIRKTPPELPPQALWIEYPRKCGLPAEKQMISERLPGARKQAVPLSGCFAARFQTDLGTQPEQWRGGPQVSHWQGFSRDRAFSPVRHGRGIPLAAIVSRPVGLRLEVTLDRIRPAGGPEALPPSVRRARFPGDTLERIPLTNPDLTVCPEELRAADPNAELLWPKFLKRSGVTMSTRGARVLDNLSRRALIVRNFGIPALVQRLATAHGEVGRARVWWRESIACSDGDSPIPDLSENNQYVLNPFIVAKELRFRDPRAEMLAWCNSERNMLTDSNELADSMPTDSKGHISEHREKCPATRGARLSEQNERLGRPRKWASDAERMAARREARRTVADGLDVAT